MTPPTHVTNLIPDYLLGLLSPRETKRVETHVHACPACRRLLAAERQIGQDVRQTLTIVSRPESGQLARLRPSPPRRTFIRPVAFLQSGQRLVAAAILLALVMIGSWSLHPGRPGRENPNPQVVTAIAVTATRAPTSTLAPDTPAYEPDVPPSPTYETFRPSLPGSPAMTLVTMKTPLPAGTPIAALPASNQP